MVASRTVALRDAGLNCTKVQGLEKPSTHDGASTAIYRVNGTCHGVIHDGREGAELVQDTTMVIGAE